jgi:hypothetical protein
MSKGRASSEFLEFFAPRKKVLAVADRGCLRAVWPASRLLTVECGRAVHLHALLTVRHRIADRLQWSAIVCVMLAQEILVGLFAPAIRGGWQFVKRNVARVLRRGR